MRTVQRLLINICSEQLAQSKAFYTTLFDFDVDFESDWFIHLISKDQQLELGIIDRHHDLVPKEFQKTPKGFYITLVVDDVDKLYDTAIAHQFDVIAKPEDTFYGQRRMLLKDPDGALVDISSPIPNFNF